MTLLGYPDQSVSAEGLHAEIESLQSRVAELTAEV